ncbi:MAG: right-handed parallel beta-helix repeat-containing protein [Tannerella sp.]|jgi:predicted outer membrane repeat protein|nr:right-handed parallel beta-helix repeat-containing protein [Tannerella sp.]
MKYQLLTTYLSATDEGRAIVNAGSVSNPLQYFTLITPASTTVIAYELVQDGTTIRLCERAVGGIYLDPLNGNDAYSGAKSNRPVKTLAKARAIWDDRNTTPGTVTDIYLLTRIILTENTTFSGGYKLTRFAGNTDRTTTMADYLIDHTGYEVIINDFTIDNGSNASTYALYNYNNSNGKLTLNNGATLIHNNTSYCIYNYSGTVTVNNGATITVGGNTGAAIYSYYATTTINDGATLTGKGTSSFYLVYVYYGTCVINGGAFKNEGTSTTARMLNHYGGTLTINGGTVDAGGAIALYSTTGTLNVNKCTLSSTNTVTGTLYSEVDVYLNGEDAKIDGLVNLARSETTFGRYFLYIKSASVTQNYNLRITATSSGKYYPSIIVRSTPSIDLEPYYTHFTMEAIPGYDFIAYAQKNETNKNLVIYSTNAVYVNDYNGNDGNTGASPALALKTLTNAVTKTTATKNYIYICDSALTVNSTQNVTSLTGDTVMPCFFRTLNTHMIEVTAGGVLTLGNIATMIRQSYNTNYTFGINGGSLVLNPGTTLFSYSAYSNTAYVVYISNGGNITMNNNTRITCSPTLLTTYSGTGIYLTGANSTATLSNGSVIEKQSGYAVYATNGAMVNINGGIIRDCVSSSVIPLYLYGNNTVVNMTAGQIINNRSTSSYYTVYVAYGSTFNFSGGEISGNNNIITNNPIYGQQVYIAAGGTMNFTGGTVIPTDSARNAIYVYGTGTTATTSGRLRLSDAAVLDSGFIYCNNPFSAPIILNEALDPSKKININLGDNMAGCTLVDGTTAPASVSNFVLNPDLTELMLNQSGNDVIVGSNAIYLHGSSGNDANDGSTATLAVKTFKRARERLQATGGDIIIVIGYANLNNADEIPNWDLSFNPDAMVRRGIGYTGYMVYIPAGKSLTLSDITIDGNKDEVYSGTGSSAILYSNSANLTIGNNAKIQNNTQYGIYVSGANSTFTMTGGEVLGNATGVYFYYTGPGTALMTGGTIHHNTTYGAYFYYTNNMSFTMTGGTVTDNGAGIMYSSSTNNNTLSITGGDISNNTSYGLYTASNNTNNIYGIKDVSITGGTFNNNGSYGIYLSNCADMAISGVQVTGNGNTGIYVTNSNIGFPGTFTMTGGNVSSNGSYGINLQTYLNYDISGNVQITNNKNSGIYSTTLIPSSISGDVLVKGNKAANGGGLYVNQGTVNVSGNVTFEADTCTTSGGAIYVPANGNAVISGNVGIIDCVNATTSTSTSYGGSAIHALGKLSMTGGSITGCKSTVSRGTVYVSGTGSNVNLTGVKISGNTAMYGGAVYVNSGGRITLDTDTITNNVSNNLTSYAAPVTGNIHIAGDISGRFALRDKCSIEGDLYLATVRDTVYVDESLLNAEIGEFHLLGNTTNGTNSVMVLGTIVVSPNGTTVTDASQFLTNFTLMNGSTGRGLDKGGTGEKHIMIVNQFFIDGTKPDNGNGSNPLMAFNKLSDLVSKNILTTSPYTTVWVSGPVTMKGQNATLPAITRNNVNLRRYTGFSVAAQPFPAYDSVMFTIDEGTTLTIQGGSSAANRFTISGEGGSSLTDASIFKNNGTLIIGGHTHLYFNPTAGAGAAIYQNGTLNLSGNVDFELYSTNTVYLPENRVINIINPLTTATPIGITVETSPVNTHLPGRIVATGTAAHVPAGAANLFYNELATDPLPIGRMENSGTANLMFYLADRNVTGAPIYLTLQEAFDAAVSADNEEVRLYGNTGESVTAEKTLRYNSQGHSVQGSFLLDSVSTVQLLDDLLADTLFIRANIFSRKAQLDKNGHGVALTEAAYFDLRLPEDASMSDWYPVNLPFDANLSAIRNVLDTASQLLYLQDYAVASFDGQRRANFGIGNQPSNPENDWQYFTDARLLNGTGYMVTTRGIRTLRFKSADLNLLSAETAPLTYYAGGAGSIHQGLNYIAQPMGVNSTVGGGIPQGGIIQISESLSSDRIGSHSYVARNVASSLIIAPYTNYFYQTAATGTVSYVKSSQPAAVRSGRTDAPSPDVPAYYEMRIYDRDPERYDALFVAASEYASPDKYEIGRDVIKLGTAGGGIRIWTYDFDIALCANEVFLENNRADIPMYIHTPEAGRKYTLYLANAAGRSSEQLWLCRDKKPVQNLTEYPEYEIEGTAGTTDEYSLRLLTGPVSNESLSGEAYVYTEKNRVVISGLPAGKEYMIFDMSGRLFATGKSDGERSIKVYAMSGIYAVQVDGKIHKAVVK